MLMLAGIDKQRKALPCANEKQNQTMGSWVRVTVKILELYKYPVGQNTFSVANLKLPSFKFFSPQSKLLSLIMFVILVARNFEEYSYCVRTNRFMVFLAISTGTVVELHVMLYPSILSSLWEAHGMFYREEPFQNVEHWEFLWSSAWVEVGLGRLGGSVSEVSSSQSWLRWWERGLHQTPGSVRSLLAILSPSLGLFHSWMRAVSLSPSSL